MRSRTLERLFQAGVAIASARSALGGPYAQWSRGPSDDPSYFPIGVWLQQPVYAAEYRTIGVNLYMGLYEGPTEDDLSRLAAAGMQTICGQNSVGLAHIADPTIVGWMLEPEPDNAQWNGSEYDPPILPQVVQGWYSAARANDPSRPVSLILGQGVAWDGWWGRGTRTNHPEDYPQYLLGSDIGSFDVYPVNGELPIQGQLWRVGYGMGRLKQWSRPGQPGWTFIETSDIDGTGGPTPAQVKSEVWLALVNGAQGLTYFTHQFAPTFNDRVLLTDAPMRAAVTAINQRIQTLAPALNSPSIDGASTIDMPSSVQLMEKRIGDDIYIFAVGSLATSVTATIQNVTLPPNSMAEVLDEGRQIPITNGQFTDDFGSYGVHLYRIVQTRSTWSGGTDGAWSSSSNWSNGIPNGASKRATFGAGPAGTTMLDVPITLGALRFQSEPTRSLVGQQLTMHDPFGPAKIDVTANASAAILSNTHLESDTVISVAPGGQLEMSGNIGGPITMTKIGAGHLAIKHVRTTQLDLREGDVQVIANGTDAATSRVSTLTIAGTPNAWGASLDLSNNAIVIDYANDDPSTVVKDQIRSGFAGGAWNGNGIRSSSASTNSGFALGYANADELFTSFPAFFGGEEIDVTTVLIDYTRYGDADLNGTVNLSDFNRLAVNFNGVGKVWSEGDFNYDGIVNLLDFNKLAGNFNQSATGVHGEPTPEDWANLAAAVPEPAISVFGASAALLLQRRRRCFQHDRGESHQRRISTTC